MGKKKPFCPAYDAPSGGGGGKGLFSKIGDISIGGPGGPKKHKPKDKDYMITKDGVELYKGSGTWGRSAAQREKDKVEKASNEVFTNMDKKMGETPEIPLAKINRAPDLLNINQINKDRRDAAYGIGKKVKKVTDFMTPDKWDALSPEERERMNESYTNKNTEYYKTDYDSDENIFRERFSKEARNKKLNELRSLNK